jgi:hypothetical protein
MEPENWLALAGLIAGVVAFGAGLRQYRDGQRWKRAEFAASETKEMLSDSETRIALRLLDWNSNEYDLSAGGRYPALDCVWVDDEILARAMAPHVTRPDGFDAAEGRIRESMDALLWYLQRVEHFLETKLISVKDVEPHLRYWMRLIGDSSTNRKPLSTLHAIWRYIDFYGFDDVQRLIKRFGYDITQFQRSSPPDDGLASNQMPPSRRLT